MQDLLRQKTSKFDQEEGNLFAKAGTANTIVTSVSRNYGYVTPKRQKRKKISLSSLLRLFERVRQRLRQSLSSIQTQCSNNLIQQSKQIDFVLQETTDLQTAITDGTKKQIENTSYNKDLLVQQLKTIEVYYFFCGVLIYSYSIKSCIRKEIICKII